MKHPNAKKRLNEFKTWGDNWDNEGAIKPDHESVDAALKFIDELVNEPKVMVSVDGLPMILINGFEIMIYPDGGAVYTTQ